MEPERNSSARACVYAGASQMDRRWPHDLQDESGDEPWLSPCLCRRSDPFDAGQTSSCNIVDREELIRVGLFVGTNILLFIAVGSKITGADSRDFLPIYISTGHVDSDPTYQDVVR